MEPLTKKQLEYFKTYEHLAKKAAFVNSRRYQSRGCLTYEDLVQEAYVGLCAAVRSPKLESHSNPGGYVMSFCSGYITHAIHRKSRMVKLPYSCMKKGEGSYHIDSSKMPEIAYESPELEAWDPRLTEFLNQLSDTEYKRFIKTGAIGAKRQKAFKQLQEAILND